MGTKATTILASALLLLGLGLGCGGDDTTEALPTISGSGEAPADPTLCEPACRVLTGATCNTAAEQNDEGQTDIDLMRACMAECAAGGFDDESLECVATSDCVDLGACFD